ERDRFEQLAARNSGLVSLGRWGGRRFGFEVHERGPSIAGWWGRGGAVRVAPPLFDTDQPRSSGRTEIRGLDAERGADLRVAVDAVDDVDGVEHVDFDLDAVIDRDFVIGERPLDL